MTQHTLAQIVRLPELEALALIIEVSTGKDIDLDLYNISDPIPVSAEHLESINTCLNVSAKPETPNITGETNIYYRRFTGSMFLEALGAQDSVIVNSEQGVVDTHGLVELFNQKYSTNLTKHDIVNEPVNDFNEAGFVNVALIFRPTHYIFLGEVIVRLKDVGVLVEDLYPDAT